MDIIKFFTGLILAALAIIFILFAIQNNQLSQVVLFPGYNFTLPLYIIVLFSFASGFVLAMIITRFEYFRAKLNIFKLIGKLKAKSKSKSKYIEE